VHAGLIKSTVLPFDIREPPQTHEADAHNRRCQWSAILGAEETLVWILLCVFWRSKYFQFVKEIRADRNRSRFEESVAARGHSATSEADVPKMKIQHFSDQRPGSKDSEGQTPERCGIHLATLIFLTVTCCHQEGSNLGSGVDVTREESALGWPGRGRGIEWITSRRFQNSKNRLSWPYLRRQVIAEVRGPSKNF
jgi:hypothetical protein